LDSTALIVDDNASLAYFTAYSLRQEIPGLKVVIAGSCTEALTLARQHRPSVLIVDLKLPDGNGLDLISDLKRILERAAFIIVTATPVSDDLGKDLFGTLMKPYDPEALIGLVRQALVSGDSEGGTASENKRAGETGSLPKQNDFHNIQNRLSAVLVGIRALRLELLAVAEDPSEVRRTIDEYADRLSAMVKEAAEELKRKA
jgi:two-component system NtrC family response regulator